MSAARSAAAAFVWGITPERFIALTCDTIAEIMGVIIAEISRPDGHLLLLSVHLDRAAAQPARARRRPFDIVHHVCRLLRHLRAHLGDYYL